MRFIDAIIFDFDGTLADTVPVLEAWYKHWAQKNNRPWPFLNLAQFKETYSQIIYEPGKHKVQEFYDYLGLPCDMHDFNHPVWPEYRQFFSSQSYNLFPHMKEILTEIYQLGSLDSQQSRRLRLGLNSNNSWKNILPCLAREKILPYFDTQVCTEQLKEYHGLENSFKIGKPCKIPIILTLQNLDALPSRALYVGDTRCDLEACKNVLLPGREKEDLIVVGANWGYEGYKLLAEGVTLNGKKLTFDHYVDHPEELLGVVQLYL